MTYRLDAHDQARAERAKAIAEMIGTVYLWVGSKISKIFSKK